ncbi:hypothetical protein A9513_015355 [Pseudomonas sp. AU12215]|nr:hypothetical protein A9513_015355 [Pseudomonas sp. AU12215]
MYRLPIQRWATLGRSLWFCAFLASSVRAGMVTRQFIGGLGRKAVMLVTPLKMRTQKQLWSGRPYWDECAANGWLSLG